MTIKLNDPQIEAIFVNEFKSDIDAFPSLRSCTG